MTREIPARSPSPSIAPVETARPVAAAPVRRRWQAPLLYSLLVLAVGVGAIFTLRAVVFYRHHVETDDAQIEGHIDPVVPRVPGYVGEVLVHDNDHVTVGQVLLRIDARDFQVHVTMAQAALTSARAAVAVAQANATAVDTARTKTTQDLARYTSLRSQQVVSPQDYDAAKAAADSATATYAAAVRQVAAAEAAVAERQADLDAAELQLSYTTIVAPDVGVVSKKNVEIGEYVQAGQPLLAIVGEAEVWVVSNFKETQLRRMRVGQSAIVNVDAYPNVEFHARIDSIAAATGAKFSLLPPDNATGNFVKVVQRIPVKLILTDPPDAEHPLRVGMNVTVTVDVG